MKRDISKEIKIVEELEELKVKAWKTPTLENMVYIISLPIAFLHAVYIPDIYGDAYFSVAFFINSILFLILSFGLTLIFCCFFKCYEGEKEIQVKVIKKYLSQETIEYVLDEIDKKPRKFLSVWRIDEILEPLKKCLAKTGWVYEDKKLKKKREKQEKVRVSKERLDKILQDKKNKEFINQLKGKGE